MMEKKLDIFYDPETDILSVWNQVPAMDADDLCEYVTVDYDYDGKVVGFTIEHAAELIMAGMETRKDK